MPALIGQVDGQFFGIANTVKAVGVETVLHPGQTQQEVVLLLIGQGHSLLVEGWHKSTGEICKLLFGAGVV